MEFQRADKRVVLSNFGIFCAWKNKINSYRNNEFNRSGATWDKEFELPGGCIRYSGLF